MKKICMIVLLSIFMNIHVAYAEQSVSDQAYEAYEKGEELYQEKQYDEALKWFKAAFNENKSKDLAFNIGLTYDELKDYLNAIKWYKTAVELGNNQGGVNLGLLYEEAFKDYPNSIKWYKKAIEMGNINAGKNLALLYEEKLKDYSNAIKWNKKAIEMGDIGAFDNISLIYHDIKKDNLTASAYYIATIDKSYSKKEILDFLRNDWKIDEATLKKAYELQKTLVPNPYTGGIE